MDRFSPGTDIVVRNAIFGRPYAIWPHPVVADDGHELAVLLRPGTNGVGPALWIKAMRDQDPAARAAFLPALASRRWQLGKWTWQRTTMLVCCWPDRYFSVNLIWEGDRFRCWYVNFQTPYQRTRLGIDTCDLHLDLEVFPDFSIRWKDEDEYAHARDLGLVTDRCHKRVDEARHQALAMVEEGEGPFGSPWPGRRPDLTSPLPELPDGARVEPVAARLRGLPE
jgi:Protein of unknown function (DUF402)